MGDRKEKQIIDLLKMKDPSGIKLFAKQYKSFMYYILTPIISNSHDRDDCISEISIRIIEKIQLYDESKGSFLSWLTALVKNTAINYKTKNGKYTEYEDINEWKDSLPSDTPTPEELILKKEREEQLLRAIHKLKQQDRLIFYRKYYYMQSTEQIALEFGTSVRAIEGKLYRIKIQLRKSLGGDFYER